ncbi:MAG: HAD-IIIA family hydrolase [Kiritimatiellales bacterium]
MQVVILAGGMGTRIRSLSQNLPKALLPVADRAFVEHQLDLLRICGLHRVLLCVGHGGDLIRRHVGDGSAFGMQVDYSEENPSALLGTGGALLNAWSKLDDVFMVLYGDSYLPFDFGAMAKAWEKLRPPVLMSVYRNLNQWDPSNTIIADGRVVRYDKHLQPGEALYIDYGVTIYKKDVFAPYRDAPLPIDLAVILSDAVKQDAVASYTTAQRFYEIGKPEGFQALENLLRKTSDDRKVPAVFIDRDGTLNEMLFDETHGRFDSPLRAEQLIVKPFARDFMDGLRVAGFRRIVVTNQPGVARGYLDEAELERIHNRLACEISPDGAAWDALYYCPHSPSKAPVHSSEYAGLCDCRKPSAGMLRRAALEHQLDLSKSWMIGDGLNDIKAGHRAGCRTILLAKVKIEQIEQFAEHSETRPDFIAKDLRAALEIILKNSAGEKP